MKKYLITYQTPAEFHDQMTQQTSEQQQEGMKAWMAWAQKVGANLADMGSPLAPSVVVTGGAPAATTAVTGTGFSVLQATDIEAAKGLLNGHPFLSVPGCSICVQEFLPIPGM